MLTTSYLPYILSYKPSHV